MGVSVMSPWQPDYDLLVPHSPSVLQRVNKSDGTTFGCNNIYDKRSKGWSAEHGATHWEWAI